MKYKVTIEGGFTGIPKKYLGHVELSNDEKSELVTAMKSTLSSNNVNIRDGLQYEVTLGKGTSKVKAHFNETNLPLTIREFINRISEN